MVDAPREWVENYFLKPFTLINLNEIDDEDIKRKRWSGIMEFVLKHIFERDFLPFFRNILGALQEIEYHNGEQFAENVLVYIFDCGEINKADFVSLVQTNFSNGGRAMTLAEQFKAEGKAEGFKESQLVIAERLLNEGVDIAFVSKITSLPLNEIKILAETLN